MFIIILIVLDLYILIVYIKLILYVINFNIVGNKFINIL